MDALSLFVLALNNTNERIGWRRPLPSPPLLPRPRRRPIIRTSLRLLLFFSFQTFFFRLSLPAAQTWFVFTTLIPTCVVIYSTLLNFNYCWFDCRCFARTSAHWFRWRIRGSFVSFRSRCDVTCQNASKESPTQRSKFILFNLNINEWRFNCWFLNVWLQQDISKRLSLPADLRIPESFLAKQASSSSPIFDGGPLTRTNRRQSLSEIGFGRMETYTKLDKLGEVLVPPFPTSLRPLQWNRQYDPFPTTTTMSPSLSVKLRTNQPANSQCIKFECLISTTSTTSGSWNIKHAEQSWAEECRERERVWVLLAQGQKNKIRSTV